MPLDHYVSQVHLRHFHSSDYDWKKMYGYKKSDGSIFICGSEDVCRMRDHNTNKYIEDERAIEEFLKFVEPKYNEEIENLRNGKITYETILTIAGFCSYVSICTPCAIRTGQAHISSMVSEYARSLEKKGKLPSPPKILGYESLSDLLDNDVVKIDVNEKYPQAIGIATILSRVATWANAHWEILHNEKQEMPFFTSDSPVALEQGTTTTSILNRIVPLSPDLAVRICPRPGKKYSNVNDITDLEIRHSKLNTNRIKIINRDIVKCAEDFLFYPLKREWVKRLVKNYSRYRVELKITKFPTSNGTYLEHTYSVSCGRES